MAAPEYNNDYYILAGDGETLIDARGAQIFAVNSEMDFEEVEDLVAYYYDDVHTLSIIPTLKFLPEASHKSVDVSELLTNLASDTSYVLSPAEREALLDLRDELP
jgi:hypothetical protein